VSRTDAAIAAPVTARRLPGPDVVRAVALIGVVVMNYHGYLLIEEAAGPDAFGDWWAATLFDPWSGPLATRFAATFVLVAGVGVTLMTRRAVAGRDGSAAARQAITELRWRLVRRGVVLYVGGLLLDVVWAGTIIPYYGAMFALSAMLFTLRSRWLVVIGVAAATVGWAVRMWRFDRAEAGRSTAWLTDPAEGSLGDYVFGLTVNGTHPLLPWLAFFCAGMVLGRVLRTAWWRPAAAGVGFVLYALATVAASSATTPFASTLLSTEPSARGVVYVSSALGTALLAYAGVDWLAERFPVATDPLRRAGQMTLTLYLLHVAVFLVAVDGLGWIEPAGLDVALGFAFAFWVAGIAAAVVWNRRVGQGPAERVYRALGG
jgi:uncharacterized membrane protein YeiB